MATVPIASLGGWEGVPPVGAANHWNWQGFRTLTRTSKHFLPSTTLFFQTLGNRRHYEQ